MSTFSENLIRLRQRDNMTQAELAKILGVSKSTVSMYECDKRKPSFEVLEAIADQFNVDMNFLYGIDGPSLPASDPHLTAILTKLSDRSDLRALLSVYDGATEEEIAYAIALIKAKRGLM